MNDSDLAGADNFEKAREMIFAGLSVSDMAQLLGVTRYLLQSRLGAVKPVGERRGRNLYSVADCAALVVKPKIDLEDAIRRLRPLDLPPALQKAFWDSQKSRQMYEERAGHLWHTHRVQSVMSRIFMIVRQRLVLACDQIDRLSPLTDEQRRLMQDVFDNLIVELQEQITNEFSRYDGTGDRQELYEKGPPAFEIPPSAEDEEALADLWADGLDFEEEL